MNINSVALVTSAAALVTGLAGMSAARRRHQEIAERIAARERCEPADIEEIAHGVRDFLREEEVSAARAVNVTAAEAAVTAASAEAVAALATGDVTLINNCNWKLQVLKESLRLLRA